MSIPTSRADHTLAIPILSISKRHRVAPLQAFAGRRDYLARGASDLDGRPASCRQDMINFDNGVSITASDGDSCTTHAGEVVLVEDTTGKGYPE